jgi:YD repeat-containing protein
LKRYFITKRQDPFGTFLTFEYTTNTLVKLTKVKDSKGRETGIVYYNPTNSPYFGALVWKITNEFSQTVEFKYSSNGCLTNIIDAAGIDSRMAYDSDRNLSNLVTPYGTTSFEYYGPTGKLARRVIEPNGAKHLYVYRNSFTNASGTALLSTTYSDRPSTTNGAYFSLPNTFENANMHQYDSLYWGPRQYALLSATVQNNLTTNFVDFFTNITSNCCHGRPRNWTLPGEGILVGPATANHQDQSPNGLENSIPT